MDINLENTNDNDNDDSSDSEEYFTALESPYVSSDEDEYFTALEFPYVSSESDEDDDGPTLNPKASSTRNKSKDYIPDPSLLQLTPEQTMITNTPDNSMESQPQPPIVSAESANAELTNLSGSVSDLSINSTVTIAGLSTTPSDPMVEYKCKKLCKTASSDAEAHPCSSPNHHPNDPCPPCPKPLRLVELECGHAWKVRCGNRFNYPICKQPCNTKFDCGHQCMSLCYEPCESQCNLWVVRTYPNCRHSKYMPCAANGTKVDRCTFPVVSELSCPGLGHGPVNTICQINKWSIRYKEPELLQPYCERKCNVEFTKEDNGCGHICQGACKTNDCGDGKLHVRCQEPCGKILVCGHECEAPCSSGCGPCPKSCDFYCSHEKCPLICGKPCKSCLEPCTYVCPHSACSKLCNEPCNKEPCTFWCPKRLPCGHRCVGFCGESCPTQCRICNVDELILGLFMISDEVEPEHKFIYLENCGHAIESEFMDEWMGSVQELDEVVLKQCPLCRKPIYYLPRYSTILSKVHQDINNIKVKINGTPEEVYGILEKVKEILYTRRREENFQYFPRTRITLMNYYNYYTNARIFNKTEATSLLNFTKTWEHINNIISTEFHESPSEVHRKLHSEYYKLLEQMLSRALPFTNMEIGDFNRELTRIADLTKLLKIYHSESGPVIDRIRPAKRIYERALRVLSEPGSYNVQRKAEFKDLIEELTQRTNVKLKLTEPERIGILEAIGLSSGRWFKCPNGHPYLITECGGAMHESQCNECGAAIGGTSHRIREDNSWAPEIDGAERPIWPNNGENWEERR